MKKTLLGILAMGLSCHAQGGEFTVQLITPPDRILKREYSVDIRVAISNGTGSAIQIVDFPSLARDSQLFFTILPQNLMDYAVWETKGLRVPNTNSWEKITTTNTWSTKHVRMLAPGQVQMWDFGELDLFPSVQSLFYNLSQVTQFDMYAQVLIGSSQWVYSNTNTVRFSQQNLKDGNVIFTGTYRGTRTFDVYEHTTDGDCFLFCTHTRVCKVPAGATPSFEVEAGTDILKVTFSDNSPPVRFNIWEGKVIP